MSKHILQGHFKMAMEMLEDLSGGLITKYNEM